MTLLLICSYPQVTHACSLWECANIQPLLYVRPTGCWARALAAHLLNRQAGELLEGARLADIRMDADTQFCPQQLVERFMQPSRHNATFSDTAALTAHSST